MNTETPAIYVACLDSYNNGILHGDWIDAIVHPFVKTNFNFLKESF